MWVAVTCWRAWILNKSCCAFFLWIRSEMCAMHPQTCPQVLRPLASAGCRSACLAWMLSVLLATVALAHAVAALHTALVLLVEGLLLGRLQLGIESFGGVATRIHGGGALCAHGAHAVDALGRAQLLHAFAIQGGGISGLRLHGLCKGIPGILLSGRERELLVQFVQMLFTALLAFLLPVLMAGCALALHMARVGHAAGRGARCYR